jgi:3-methyl-2-oxobutanoate hydroxymethyltransferase
MSRKVTTAVFRRMKATGEKITVLTAYDYPTARILDRNNVEAILVGDSLGMVLLGYNDTTQVTMEDMLHHIKAVSRGTEQAMVIGDMPFLSYHLGVEQSVRNAGRIIQEGHAQAVKLEGGREVVQDVKAIVRAGIPVMGHLGLTPQSIHQIGGYFVQGKSKDQAEKLIEDAKALEDAGSFAVVLECVPAELASLITQKLAIPTIGIGAGIGCDGQVLVTHDIVGIYQGKTASYVKQYAQLGNLMAEAVLQYVQEVKAGIFPQDQHSFHMEKDELNRINVGEN